MESAQELDEENVRTFFEEIDEEVRPVQPDVTLAWGKQVSS
jgi:hypothetical protein